jgi:hypothetical protein
MTLLRGALPSALLALLAGCDTLVDPSYPGEAMARLRGTIVGFGVEQVGDSAAILWNRNVGPSVPSGPFGLAPLVPSFPSGLTIHVLAPPPEEAYFGVTGENAQIAEAYLYLVRPGTTEPIASLDLVGTAVDSVLVYVRGEVQPGSMTASYLGGVRAPGYHLLDWRATAELTDAQSHFSERCAAEMPGAAAACRAKRLYRLVDTPADLDTELVFYRQGGGP